MGFPVQGPAVGDLHDPGLSAALGRVKDGCFLINVEKSLLHNLFRLTLVAQDAERDAVHKPGISAKQGFQSVCILRLQTRHQLFVAGSARGCWLRRRNRTSFVAGPDQRDGQRASVCGGAHICGAREPALSATREIRPRTRGQLPKLIRCFAQHTPAVNRFSRQKRAQKMRRKILSIWYRFARYAVYRNSCAWSRTAKMGYWRQHRNPLGGEYIRISMRNVIRAVMVCALLSGVLHAQSTSASVTGRVTDPRKAVIREAQVTAINTGTGIRYQGLTNETGTYYVSNLPPGRYRIEVEKLGFKAVIQAGVILHVQDAVEVNFEMILGSASESVTVDGSSPPLDTESATVGTVVEQRKANELPLNGRNVFNLIVLAPSVIPQGSSTGPPVGVNPFGWNNYQVNGSFGNQSAEYLDGQPLNIGYINLPILIPTQDSIQEFKVQTSNLEAEWGKFAGGVTSLSTKGGTNSLHGEAYEYLRNRIFNANDFFLNSAGKPRPPWVQNQFGAEIGGPLRLPRYDGRNRTFWFLSWEGFRLRTGEPFTTTVPTAAERAGDFSAIHTQIMDPCAGVVNAQGACPGSIAVPSLFARNVIPADRINPTSKALLNSWPLPNVAGVVTPSGTINNFNTVASTGGNQDQIVARIDQDINSKQRMFVRFSHWNVLDLPTDPLG